MRMTNKIVLAILIFTVFTRQSIQLVVNRKFNILKDVVEIQMSDNGQMLGALNRTHVSLYNSYTGHQITLIQSQTEPLTLSFSGDSNLLAVSFADGNIALYQIYDNSYQAIMKVVGSYKAQTKGDDNFTNIVGACFSSDSKSVIFADKDGDIIRWQIDGQVIIGSFSGALPSKIACSRSNPNEFIIGGDAMQENKTAVLKIFSFNTVTKKIQFQRQLNCEWLYYINYLAYGYVGSSIYVLSNEHSVRVYELPEYNYTLFYQGVGEMFKLVLGKVKGTFAVVNETHVILQEGALAQPISAVATYATTARTMAMNPNGNRLLYIDLTQNTNALDVCPQGSYFDSISNKCVNCQLKCTVCAANSQFCYECQPAHFLSQQKCFKCVEKCERCTSLQECDICAHPFMSRNGQCLCQEGENIDSLTCECEDGYILNKGVCVERGLQFWAFALIVGGFSLVLCSVAVVNIILMRRNEKTRVHKLLADPNQ